MDSAALDVAGEHPPDPPRARGRRRPLLGGLLVKEGLINRVQLEKALSLQEALESRQPLGQILVERKLVTQPELKQVLEKYRKEYRLGDVLIETRVITNEHLEAALAYQRKTDVSLGEALVQLGTISERQLKQALAIQLRIAFVDLDECVLDPALGRLISESYARHHRVVPIAKTDGWITLAMDDPTDCEVPEELRSSTGCRIEVVTSTRAGLDRALAQVYGERPGTRPERRPRDDGDPVHGEPERIVPTVPAAPPAPGPPGQLTRSEPAVAGEIRLGAIRAGIDAVRRLVTGWDAAIGTVEALSREKDERRAAFQRVERDLLEARRERDELRRELEARSRALAEAEAAHATLRESEAATRRSLGELQGRYDALLHEQKLVTDQLVVILRRLRP